MKTFEQKKQEIFEMTDPRQAYIKVLTDKELSLLEIQEITLAYQKKHKIEIEDMEFYPNGERVLTPEMFE